MPRKKKTEKMTAGVWNPSKLSTVLEDLTFLYGDFCRTRHGIVTLSSLAAWEQTTEKCIKALQELEPVIADMANLLSDDVTEEEDDEVSFNRVAQEETGPSPSET